MDRLLNRGDRSYIYSDFAAVVSFIPSLPQVRQMYKGGHVLLWVPLHGVSLTRPLLRGRRLPENSGLFSNAHVQL